MINLEQATASSIRNCDEDELVRHLRSDNLIEASSHVNVANLTAALRDVEDYGLMDQRMDTSLWLNSSAGLHNDSHIGNLTNALRSTDGSQLMEQSSDTSSFIMNLREMNHTCSSALNGSPSHGSNMRNTTNNDDLSATGSNIINDNGMDMISVFDESNHTVEQSLNFQNDMTNPNIVTESYFIEDTIYDDDEEYDDEREAFLNHEDAFLNYFNRFEKLDDIINDEDYNTTVLANLVVSKLEIIVSILKYSKKYSLPNCAVADLFKMFNSFVENPILPDTRYKIDQLFFPGGGIKFYAVCSTCKTFIGEFNKSMSTIFCSVCEQDINLKDPLYRDFFITLDIENEIKHLLESYEDYYKKVVSGGRDVSENHISDFYDGRKYKEIVNSLPEHHRNNYATVTLNADGAPVFKSSKFSIWLIQLSINEVPMEVRTQRTIAHTVWFGHDKPDMVSYLRPVVETLNCLSRNGLECIFSDGPKKIFVYGVCSCDDSVARAPMQGTTQFNGYFGCDWCLHPGVRVLHKTGYATKYPLLDYVPPRRSAAGTVQNMQEAFDINAAVEGVKKATPLILLYKLDIIDGLVPDKLHMGDEGIANQFTELWCGTTGQPYSITKQEIELLDEYIKNIKVPTQAVRLSRSIKDRKFWKGSEWENFTFFYNVPALSIIPRLNIYVQHWSLFVEALYLLSQNHIPITDVQRAYTLSKQFVAGTEELYTADAMTYNVHQMLHLPQSVADWGPLPMHSGYVFESGNGKILRAVKAAKGVLNQVCRHLTFGESIRKLEKIIRLKEFSPIINYLDHLDGKFVEKTYRGLICRYFGLPVKVSNVIKEALSLSDLDALAYNKMAKNQSLFKSHNCLRADNSYARLRNGDYIKLQQFVVSLHDNIEYTVYEKINVQMNSISGHLQSLKEVNDIDNISRFVKTEEIDKLCVFSSIGGKRFISALPNMFWK